MNVKTKTLGMYQSRNILQCVHNGMFILLMIIRMIYLCLYVCLLCIYVLIQFADLMSIRNVHLLQQIKDVEKS